MVEAPLVGIIMGSQSDWETMRNAANTLDALGVAHEVRIVSATAPRTECPTMPSRRAGGA